MWIGLALLCALFVGTGDILSKFALRKSHEGIVGLARLLFTLPLLGIAAILWGIPPLPFPFWLILLGMIPFELSAFLLYLRAIRIAPISLTIPFLALTPVFTILTSWLILGERVSFFGSFGILAIVLGAYLLYLENPQQSPFLPILSLFREQGSRFMIIAAFLYSITSNLGKRAIQLSDPIAFAFLYQLIDTFFLWLLVWRGKVAFTRVGREILSQWKLYLALGCVVAVGLLFHCIGIAQGPVPYFIAIKRMSLVAGVVYGGILFKEKKIAQRLIATMMMVLGLGLIVVFQ